MVFHWSQSDSKSPQVSRTLLSILAVLNNAVVWMVSTRPPTYKSSRLFNNPLVTIPNAFGTVTKGLLKGLEDLDIIIIIIIIIIIYSLMVIHWSFGNSKSPQVLRTLLIILAVLKNVVVWLVSTLPPTSKSSRPLVILQLFCQKHQSKLVQSSLSCSTAFSIL